MPFSTTSSPRAPPATRAPRAASRPSRRSPGLREGAGGPPGAVAADPFGLGPLFEVVAARKAHPEPGSYTNRLLAKGIEKCAQKVGEEGVETALAAVTRDDAGLAAEIADLMYHVVVLMAARGLSPGAVAAELAERRQKRRGTRPEEK